jgi:phosphoribosylglycinamide formyltransferase 1
VAGRASQGTSRRGGQAVIRRLRLGVLISGGGTTLVNLQRVIEAGELAAEIVAVIASRPECVGLERARSAGLRTWCYRRRDFASTEQFSTALFDVCRAQDVDLVVCAGFLAQLRIPGDFSGRVMNIHPSLIPAFSGAGMHGEHVHAAVLQRGCRVSGCTVHFVDDEYDHGPIILQETVPVLDSDTPETLAARVFEVECRAYPDAIRLFAEGQLEIVGSRVHRRLQSGARPDTSSSPAGSSPTGP